jgi:hypothetical protein
MSICMSSGSQPRMKTPNDWGKARSGGNATFLQRASHSRLKLPSHD